MQPVNTYNNIHGIQPIANVTSRYSTTYSANDMPINHHTNFVDETSSSHRRYNNLTPNYMKNVYSPSLAPSSGSTTENFLKMSIRCMGKEAFERRTYNNIDLCIDWLLFALPLVTFQ